MRENPQSALFIAGFCAVVGGVSGWSVPAAAVVGGLVLMAVAVWPFLRGRD